MAGGGGARRGRPRCSGTTQFVYCPHTDIVSRPSAAPSLRFSPAPISLVTCNYHPRLLHRVFVTVCGVRAPAQYAWAMSWYFRWMFSQQQDPSAAVPAVNKPRSKSLDGGNPVDVVKHHHNLQPPVAAPATFQLATLQPVTTAQSPIRLPVTMLSALPFVCISWYNYTDTRTPSHSHPWYSSSLLSTPAFSLTPTFSRCFILSLPAEIVTAVARSELTQYSLLLLLFYTYTCCITIVIHVARTRVPFCIRQSQLGHRGGYTLALSNKRLSIKYIQQK